MATGTAAAESVRSRTFADRIVAALPLLSVFVWLCAFYAWEAWRHSTPWLFIDELEMAELSRSFAHTGHTLLRGNPYSLHSLYVILTAPAWRLPSVAQAYATAKYIGVFVMSLSIFPAYALARMVASPRASLVAAAGATVMPTLVYSSYLTPEPLAYAWSTLCLFLIAKALVTRGRRWIAAAVIASLVAVAVKGALAVMPAVLLASALFMLWSSERGRRWRAGWSEGDWTGWLFLVAGAVIVAGGLVSQFSLQYQLMTWYRHGWTFWHAVRAAGSLTIGIAVLPLVVGVAVLFRAPGERTTPELRAYRSVLVAAALVFGLYTGIKGAYNQYSFGNRIWERNLMYVGPLLFVAVAVWLDRRRLNLRALLVGLAVAAFVVLKTPYQMQYRFSSDSPGLAILGEANRLLAFTPSDARILLLCVLALSAGLVLAPHARRLPPRAWGAIAASAVAFVLAWSVSAELSASAGTTALSKAYVANIRRPMDWVEQKTHGARTVYIGQSMDSGADESEWLLEFWNPSVLDVWSLDGTAPGPGSTLTPDVRGADGVLLDSSHHPITRDVYAVLDPGIDVAGKLVKPRHAHSGGGGTQYWRLVKVAEPIRLLGSVTGVYPDHWSGAAPAAYTRYGGGPGIFRITVSRAEALGRPPSTPVAIVMGTLAIGPDRQPKIGHVTKIVRFTLGGHESRTYGIRPPGPRFRVEVDVLKPFVPAETPGADSSDRRELGAVLTFRFRPGKRRTGR